MSGLIWGGIGQGIANAGSTIGSYMMQSALQDDRQEERRREREEDARRQAERDALYRRTADQQMAGKSGGGADGGMAAADIAEGGKDEGLLARRAGMTVPELRALRRLSETGDAEPFKRDTTRYKEEVEGADTTDAVSRKYAREMGLTEVVKELPPGFEREARAKLQTLAKIEESYRLGGKYDDVTKGRRNQQEIDMSEAAVAKPEAAGIIGQGMAAGAGKDLVGGDSNVTRNKFTGATSTTPVGESVIAENRAQADRARREQPGKNEELPTLQQMRKSAEETLRDARKALTEFDKLNTGDLSRPGREKLLEQRRALEAEVTGARDELKKISDRLSKRLGKPSEAPAPAPAPAPTSAPAEAKKPPSISEVQGAPAGSAIGAFVAGRGWEVKDKSGRVIGYVRK
jgi:hypothetical protein